MSTDNCTVARTLALVGDRWTLLVLREAFNGVRRFDDLHRHLGVAPNVLSRRLATLVADGLLERAPYRDAGQRTRHEYRLTPKGWDLQPVVVALMAFGDRHLADPEGPPVRLRHTGCGAPVGVRVACEDGHDVTPRHITVEPGPSAHLATG
jgi:DNA-binding HxlR family transcriptional regulator